MQQTLAGCTVNRLYRNLIGVGSFFLVAACNSRVKLLDHGLELGLLSTILCAQFLGLLVSFC